MTPEQVAELRELKRQETKLYVSIRRLTKRNMKSARLDTFIEQRDGLLAKMEPLQDLMLSELKPYGKDDWLMLWAVRLYYGGYSAFETADTFGYKNGQNLILQKIKKAERLVTNDDQ